MRLRVLFVAAMCCAGGAEEVGPAASGGWRPNLGSAPVHAGTPRVAGPTSSGPPASLPSQFVIDDFESTAAWSTIPADGVQMRLSSDAGDQGRALRIDFDFQKGGGYAVARRAVDLPLPERYAFVLRYRGECLPNNLELKLVDSTGANVWWCNRRDVVFPREWQTLVTRRRQITFAWGPAGGGEIRRVAAIEIAITAGQGGQGAVWLDQLELRELPPPAEGPPTARASSQRAGHAAARALDGASGTSWASSARDRAPWLELDFGGERELGGLVVDWAAGRHPARYVVEARDQDGAWQSLRTVQGDGGRDHLHLPETETSALRLLALAVPAGGCELVDVAVQPLDWASSLEKFFQAVAADAPRGDYPRGITGEQSYWTVVGVDGDTQEGLVDEAGAVEAGKRGFSVEPFLWSGGRLWTWADATVTRGLAADRLPIPSVVWSADSLELATTVFATGEREASSLVMSYRVRNHAARPREATLYLALRPFQVNPPAQFLNTPGGVAPIHALSREGRFVRVGEERGVVSLTEPDGFGATTFDQGNVVSWLRKGRLPPSPSVRDTFGFASGALAYRLDLNAREAGEVVVQIPLHGTRSTALIPMRPGEEVESTERALAAAVRDWGRALAGVEIGLPPSAAHVAEALQAQIGFILVNRDGPSIQPGSRAYERSWIRDGSLTSSALLRFGHERAVRDFVEWFGSHQYENGKVPCCVDHRGADPVPEHDSHGEFIYIAAEYHRMTGDRAAVERWWPRVRAAAAYLDTLRAQRRTAEYRAPGKREFFGLLPPSISHEGYSAKPMHSYWDDLFALRGFADAAYLARVLGQRADAARLERSRAEFARDLTASIRATMARHQIDYVPGCADLGDFDATSTTIALSPVQAGSVVPEAALRRTFERYWQNFERRRRGEEPWEAYTPYEWRNLGAFVRLGWRARADSVLSYFMRDRRPEGWPQWPEVVWRDARAPRFLGDLPHTWVGSDFVRSVLDMLAFERESDEALVIGAGVPERWVREAPGVSVRDLRTRFGKLGFTMRGAGEGVEVRIAAEQVPPGGFVVAAPGVTARWRATVNGTRVQVSPAGEVRVRTLPATVRLEP